MTMIFNETERKLIRGIKHAVDARGADWVYPIYSEATKDWFEEGSTAVCVNTLSDGSAACIVGFAALDAGLQVPREGGVYTCARKYWKLPLEGYVVRALGVAQSTQDSRQNWGTAFEGFERSLLGDGATREQLDAIYAKGSIDLEKAEAIINFPAIVPVPVLTDAEVLEALDFEVAHA